MMHETLQGIENELTKREHSYGLLRKEYDRTRTHLSSRISKLEETALEVLAAYLDYAADNGAPTEELGDAMLVLFEIVHGRPDPRRR